MNMLNERQETSKLMLIANYSGMYGSERMLTFLIAALRETFTLDLLINPSVSLNLSDIHGVPIQKQFFHVISKENKFIAALDLFRWFRLLLKYRPNIVVTNISLIPAPLLIARLLGIKTVVFIRESLVDHPFFFRIYQKYLFLFASHIVCNSQYTASMFSLPKARVHIVSDCVESAAVLMPTEKFCISLLFVGRLSERKGLSILLDALRILDEYGQALIHVTMVGDCLENQESFLASMKVEFARLNSFKISWIGYQKNPWAYADWGSVLIAPSLFPETFGLTVAEALVRGVPVVATNVGAYPELLQNRVNGFQCETTAEDLANKIKQVLHLEATEYQRLSAGAVRSAPVYAIEKYEESIRGLFCKLFQ